MDVRVENLKRRYSQSQDESDLFALNRYLQRANRHLYIEPFRPLFEKWAKEATNFKFKLKNEVKPTEFSFYYDKKGICRCTITYYTAYLAPAFEENPKRKPSEIFSIFKDLSKIEGYRLKFSKFAIYSAPTGQYVAARFRTLHSGFIRQSKHMKVHYLTFEMKMELL